MTYKSIVLLFFAISVGACGPSPPRRLRLAVTTSTRDSGLLDQILPIFEKESGLAVDVIALGTGKALRLAELGEVDALITHAEVAERQFMRAGYGERRVSFMSNEFLIVGPVANPANVPKNDATAALQAIYQNSQKFISRADESGTHQRERELWAQLSPKRPEWSGYTEAGQGMAATLRMASELQAYTLTDSGTWLNLRKSLQLQTQVRGDPKLLNIYSAMTVSPQRHPQRNFSGACKLIDFLISDKAKQAILNYRIDGEPLFQAIDSPLELYKQALGPTQTRPGLIQGSLQAAAQLILQRDPKVLAAAWRSLWISFLAIATASLLALPLGIGLARMNHGPARSSILAILRGALGLPTVFVGLLVFALCAHEGLLGPLEILYSPYAIIFGELLLALPIIAVLTENALSALDPKLRETALILGASPLQATLTELSEIRASILLALISAFGRCVTELGVAMMVGGNIPGRTRTLATAIALETGQGQFERGLAMGLILLSITILCSAIGSWISRESVKP